MCTFAKGFAAGLPMAGFGGKQKIMDLVASNTVPQFGTYNGNPLCIAGALAALEELGYTDVHNIGGTDTYDGDNWIFGDSDSTRNKCSSIMEAMSWNGQEA